MVVFFLAAVYFTLVGLKWDTSEVYGIYVLYSRLQCKILLMSEAIQHAISVYASVTSPEDI